MPAADSGEKMSIHPEDFAKYISHTQEGIAACSLPLKAYGGLFYRDVMRYTRVWNTKGLFESDCIPKSVSLTGNNFVYFAIAAERLLGELLQKADHITGNEHAKLEDVFGDLSIKEIKVNQGLSHA